MKHYQRKYYGCLVMVFCMIVGTLLLFASETESDLVGMAGEVGVHGEGYDEEQILKEGGYLFFEFDKSGSWNDEEYKITYTASGLYYMYGLDNNFHSNYVTYNDALNAMRGHLETTYSSTGVEVSVYYKSDVGTYELQYASKYYEGAEATELWTDFYSSSSTTTNTETMAGSDDATATIADSPEDTTAISSTEEGVSSTTETKTTSTSSATSSSSSSGASSSSVGDSSSVPVGATEISITSEKKIVYIYDDANTALTYTENSNTYTKTGQVFVKNTETGHFDSYGLTKDNEGNLYLFTIEGGGANVYIDIDTGNKYQKNEQGLLVMVNGGSTVFTAEVLAQVKEDVDASEKLVSILEEKSADESLKKKSVEERKAKDDYTEQLNNLASSLSRDLGRVVTIQELEEEQDKITTYLRETSSDYKDVKYDILTDTYSGKYKEYTYNYNAEEERMEITFDGKTYYKETEKGKTTYYEVNADGKTVRLKGEDEKKAKNVVKEGTTLYEDEIVDEVKDARNRKCGADDTTCLPPSLREQAYMNRIYNEQEQQVKGLITGWLNNLIDKKLGGWSKGVPAGICKYIFGLEYYRNEGFVAMPGNTSAEQLQSTLIANSRTVMIEGEKEEITENLYRYAYTLRILANTGMEWQTYLSNSCTGETSMDIFYDYGSLSAAEYYSFHYAGAGSQDMIFDCTTEECLFDQACVQLSDEEGPICVSLVHGAGFETPVAGQEYDCIIEGTE